MLVLNLPHMTLHPISRYSDIAPEARAEDVYFIVTSMVDFAMKRHASLSELC